MAVSFLRTARLLFRPFELSDLEALAAIVADPDVAVFVGDGRPLSRDQAAKWIERSRANVEAFGHGTGAVVEAMSGRLVGWAGFARPEGQPEELIYGLAKSAWGKGYGTELLIGLIAWSRDDLGKTEIIATVDPANTASVRMMTGQGFRRIGPCRDDADTDLYKLDF